MLLAALRVSAAPCEPVLLNVAREDGALFLTWNGGSAEPYVVRWRQAGEEAWHRVEVTGRVTHSIGDLVNGISYEAEVLRASCETPSNRVTAFPKPRWNCGGVPLAQGGLAMSLFCAKPALDRYLEEHAIDPLTLTCRGAKVTSWDENVPDCLYVTRGEDRGLLLQRGADDALLAQRPVEDAVVRNAARAAVWGGVAAFSAEPRARSVGDAVARTGRVTNFAAAASRRVTEGGAIVSSVVEFTPKRPLPRRYAIYLEGHDGSGVDLGATTIDWLLERGWSVISVDMPLAGLNAADGIGAVPAHNRMHSEDDGVTSPIARFMSPVKAVVDGIFEASGGECDLLLIGRSGGGWTAYVYGAIDERVDAVVQVAGGKPSSERLGSVFGALDVGDYEQFAPHLYSVVPHERLMVAAGSRGSLHIFNRNDPCCYRLEPDDPLVAYLASAGVTQGKRITAFVDSDNREHSIGPSAYNELERFLAATFPPPAPRRRSASR